MPDNKSQNQGQDPGKKIQGNRGQHGGDKSSREIERENMNQVGNDNDLDEDIEEGEITQRNPRMGEQGEQGQVDRGGQGGIDRNRNRE